MAVEVVIVKHLVHFFCMDQGFISMLKLVLKTIVKRMKYIGESYCTRILVAIHTTEK